MHHFVSRLVLHIIEKYIGMSLSDLKMIMIDTIMMKNAQALLGKLPLFIRISSQNRQTK
jgi:hypothetical protein